MAAFNFSTTVFKTTATSDKVTVDGYEACNLLTNTSSWSSSKGFLVENFVRSPANITFEFACSIEIESIVIHGVVGAQRSCGYEIFTQAQTKYGNELLGREENGDGKSKGKKTHEGVFTSIGKFNKLEAETFTFRNNRYRQRPPYSVLTRMSERHFDGTKHVEAELRSRNVTNLTRVSHLTIRVNRVVPGSVAAVKWVEIWGQPATSTPTEVISRILNIHNELINQDYTERKSETSSFKEKTVVQDSQVPVIDETKVNIPSDFLDAITYEVMMIPILLPSGYTVDQMTLEKHNREQASWGRAPNDPFTGKSFTANAKPVSNAALKVRIDQFLLKYGSDVSVNSRTVGSRSVFNFANVSSLVSNEDKSSNSAEKKPIVVKGKLQSTANHYKEPTKLSHAVAVKATKKRPVSPSEPSISSKKLRSTTYSSIPMIDLTGEPSNTSCSSAIVTKIVNTRNDHEKYLSSTLNDALDSALNALPSFSCRTIHDTQSKCIECDETFEVGGAYQLPCKHKICRICITKGANSEIKCPKCNKLFSRSSIVKIHL